MAHILVVDDQPQVHEFVKRSLEPQHQVFSVENGKDAVDAIFNHQIELVLMDVEMPGFLKGDQYLEIIKRSLRKRRVTFVLFSTLDEYELRDRAEQVGADGYIVKTFHEKLLQLHVKKYLS